jgi:hypothetical protein
MTAEWDSPGSCVSHRDTLASMSIDEVIGTNVHELVWRRRLQQRPVYEAMGLSRASFAKKLRGEVVWNARDIAAVAGVLEVEPGVLFTLPHLDSNQEPAGHVTSTAAVLDLPAAALLTEPTRVAS